MLSQHDGHLMPEPKPASRVRRLRKRWILLGFSLCAILGWSALQHPRVRAQIKARIHHAIEQQLGLIAALGPVTVELPLRVVARSIRLTHPKQGLLVSATRVVIEPSWLELLRGRVEIARLQVEGAYVRLRVVDGRVVNLPTLRAAKSKSAATPLYRLPLDELIVRRAHLYIDGAPSFAGSLDRLNLVARLSEGTRVSVQSSVGNGYVEYEGQREQVKGIALEAHLTPDAIEVRRFRVESTSLDLSVSEARAGLPLAHGRYRARVKLNADLAKLAAWPLGVDLPPIDGALRLVASVDGAGRTFHTTSQVHLEDAHVAGFGFGVLDLNVEATPDEVRLLAGSQGQIVQNGGLATLEGRVGLTGDMPIEVKGRVPHLEFHKLMDQLGVTKDCIVNWVLRGGFDIRGTLNPIAINGPIWVDHLSFKALSGPWHDPKSTEIIGTPPGRIAGRVVIRPDALRFENLHGHLPRSEIFATVHVGFGDALAVTAYGDHFDLLDSTGLVGMPLTGVGKFMLDVGGTYSDTTLTGSLDMQDVSIDGNRLGRTRTNAVLEKDGLAVRFKNTVVDKNATHYVIDDLLLDFTEHFSIDGSAHLDRLVLADFYHTFLLENDPTFRPYQGVASGDVKAHYTLGFPGDDADGTLVVDSDLDIERVTVHGVPFGPGRVAGLFTWRHISEGTRGIELALSDLHVKLGSGSLHASGRMGLGAKLKMTVLAEKLSLGDLDASRVLPERTSGELNGVGSVTGTLFQPVADLDVGLTGAIVGQRSLGDLRTYVKLTHRDDPWVKAAAKWNRDAPPAGERCASARIGLSHANWKTDDEATVGEPIAPMGYVLCGRGFDGKLALDMVIGVGEGAPVRGRATVDKLPMAWFFGPRKRGDLPITGAVSGRVDLSAGMLSHPDSFEGRVSLSSFHLGRDKAWIESDGPLLVRLTGAGAIVERARLVGNGSVLAVDGGASVAFGLQTTLHGDVDLSALSVLVPGISRSTGRFTLDVKVTGKPEAPSIYGRAALSGGTLSLEGYSQTLDNVSASIAFSEREVLLEQFDGLLAGGKISARGSASIRGQAIDYYELFVSARDVNIEPYAGVEVAFTADTRLTSGPLSRIPELTGTVHLLRARYKRPFSLGITERLTGFSQAKRVYRETYDPALDRIAFDLKLVDDEPIRISNNLLTAELRIEDSERPFRIVGTDQRVGVLGTLQLTRGTLRFRSSQFSLEQGTVRFDDEHRIRPRLDIHARTEFRRAADASGARWLIDLHASGETDNLKIETSSDPALAQEDIALLLTAGLTRAEAERLGTGSLTGGAALEALATVSGVDREVKRALPLIDDFNVTSAYSVRTNRTEPQVVVGKRLSESVRASATTGLTADSNFKTGVEWRLGNQTSVEAAYDNVQTTTSSQFGNVGLDLRWRLEFD